MLTQSKLKELLHYDPTTGVFVWIKRKGNVAGYARKGGYIDIAINGEKYKAHRLAWLYQTGSLPKEQIDHKNGILHDNSWENLREVSNALNQQNTKVPSTNRSGFKGVYNHKNKWIAEIVVNKKKIHIGCFDTAVEAALARCAYEDQCPEWTGDHREPNKIKLRALGHKV